MQPLKDFTWFKVGGQAEVFFKARSIAQLCSFLKQLDERVPVNIIGAGSNLLVRDELVEGVVIKLAGDFVKISTPKEDAPALMVGCGCLDVNVAYACLERGIGGMEFMIGIPGTVGGAIAMNAGCFGGEIKDVLTSMQAVTRDGKILEIGREDFKFSYRKNNLNSLGYIYATATLMGAFANKEEISKKMERIILERKGSQPSGGRTGGSTFKNAIDSGKKSWELIDSCGLRGFRIGGAHVSNKHCNFIITDDTAIAKDITDLISYIKKTVFEKTGITLETEIVLM